MLIFRQKGFFVESKIGSVPEGTTQLIPNERDVTVGSKLTIIADFIDLDNDMDRVEFYLNGSLQYVDNEAPFSFVFKPYTEASVQFIDRGWEMTSVGYDKSETPLYIHNPGLSGVPRFFQTSRLSTPIKNEEFTDGQVIDIRVDIIGSQTWTGLRLGEGYFGQRKVYCHCN